MGLFRNSSEHAYDSIYWNIIQEQAITYEERKTAGKEDFNGGYAIDNTLDNVYGALPQLYLLEHNSSPVELNAYGLKNNFAKYLWAAFPNGSPNPKPTLMY